MCGITGFFSPDSFFSAGDLQTITRRIAHRGPDAEGFFTDHFCGLGHRRLSILDLSVSANQPMRSADGRFVMVFNGEVYNFRQIARELNLPLRTTSDTEVILEAFAREGTVCLNRLNGMFAIAVYDTQQRVLYLIRDQMGIKPLFYFWDGKHLAFASELKSLTALPQLRLSVNEAAIRQFLHVGYIPAPDTIYRNVHKLPAGTCLTISADGLIQQRYWSLADAMEEKRGGNEPEAKKRLNELLSQSVRDQLVSDVPLGVLLSGGVDSSLVAALAVEQSDSKINTFSIGFQEPQFDESAYARQVATHLGTDHHELMVSATDAKQLVETMLDVYDEPYADSSAIPTMLLSQFTRQHVTVALGGDGADELFFGYGMYQWAARLAKPGVPFFRKPLAFALSQLTPATYQKAARMLDFSEGESVASHIFSQEQGFFTSKEIRSLTASPQPPPKEGEFGSLPWGEAAERQSLFDMQYYLPDDLLVKIDRASMQYGLEARVPYLDQRVVEFALNLSPALKYRKGVSKYLLKEVLYRYVPRQLFARPKRGFSIPLHQWLRQDLRFLIDEYLNENVVSRYGMVNKESVNSLKARFLAGNDFVYNRVWLLIVLHRWLVKNQV